MKRIFMFLGLTFLFTWSCAFGLMAMGGLSNPYAQFVFMGFMLIPAVCVILTRLITREGFGNMRLKPHVKGNVKLYLAAWFLPAILIAIGSFIYFLIFPDNFDPKMSAMAALYAQRRVEMPLNTIILIQMVVGVVLTPALNLIPCLGEELGWRGYLLPKLCEKLSTSKAILITGIIWGIWHAPMIAMGHNYGLEYKTAPFGGIVAMTIFCIFVGALFSYLALRIKSAIPAALAHGGLNGFATTGLWFVKGVSNPLVGPAPMGIIGGIGFIVVGFICFYFSRKIKPPSSEIIENGIHGLV